ncbi:HK97 gp10 family phage protein [Geobacillus kaustophilus]|uniref:HK97 gp10 family phage protein n=1 Tax=Geobacillus kaustophilus TaxID=1462 RepID=UPI0005CDA4BA|nr:HK97 gp10 family phage protein [Geobacillus kaustophilus]
MANIPIDRLADELVAAVKEYTDDVAEGVRKTVDRTARKVLQETKALAPKRTGEYANGFGITKEDGYGTTKRIVWNKKHYRRVHLLEFGHAKVNGGRVPAYPHLRPAYEKHGAALPDELKKVIQNGG